MADFRNEEGSTGYLKEGKFAPFASQEEADKGGPETEQEAPEQEEGEPAKRGRKPAAKE